MTTTGASYYHNFDREFPLTEWLGLDLIDLRPSLSMSVRICVWSVIVFADVPHG